MKKSIVALLLAFVLTFALVGCGNSQTSSSTEATSDTAQTAVVPEMDSSDFVLLTDVVPDAILEIRYYSTYNFVGDRIDGYEQPTALLTKEAAAALKNASDELKAKGYRLKIYDAYRPQKAVTHFMNWAKDIDDTRMKEYFFPSLTNRFCLIRDILPRNLVTAEAAQLISRSLI